MRETKAVLILPSAQRSEVLIVIKNFFPQNTFHTLHILRNLSHHGNFQITCSLQKQVQFSFVRTEQRHKEVQVSFTPRTLQSIKCQWTNEPLRPYVVLAWIKASFSLTLKKLADSQADPAVLSCASSSSRVLLLLAKLDVTWMWRWVRHLQRAAQQ